MYVLTGFVHDLFYTLQISKRTIDGERTKKVYPPFLKRNT